MDAFSPKATQARQRCS